MLLSVSAQISFRGGRIVHNTVPVLYWLYLAVLLWSSEHSMAIQEPTASAGLSLKGTEWRHLSFSALCLWCTRWKQDLDFLVKLPVLALSEWEAIFLPLHLQLPAEYCFGWELRNLSSLPQRMLSHFATCPSGCSLAQGFQSDAFPHLVLKHVLCSNCLCITQLGKYQGGHLLYVIKVWRCFSLGHPVAPDPWNHPTTQEYVSKNFNMQKWYVTPCLTCRMWICQSLIPSTFYNTVNSFTIKNVINVVLWLL